MKAVLNIENTDLANALGQALWVVANSERASGICLFDAISRGEFELPGGVKAASKRQKPLYARARSPN